MPGSFVFADTGENDNETIGLQGSTSKSNIVGGVSCTATKNIYLSGPVFNAYVLSTAATNIGTIGYTYWTVREYCPSNQTYPVWRQWSGHVNYGDYSYYQLSSEYFDYCPDGVEQYQNLGNHDFKQGTDVWQPEVNRIEDH